MAAGPLPVTLLLAHGHGLLILLLTASGLAGSVAVRVRRARRRAADEHARRLAQALRMLEAAEIVQAAYDDWVRHEAARGHQDLERWRRTHQL